ncbi:MAG: DNA-binding response regulator [Desulfuromonas sp.]|nr:MAG: DNA-binding response regulator [Desulfuromonas sp.]
MNVIRVALADDHNILREGLSMLLRKQDYIEVVAEASDGNEALSIVRQHRPDVLLMDIAMPEINGLKAIGMVHAIAPETKVVILSSYEKDAYVHQALDAGAIGYVIKGASSVELLEAIRNAAKGKFFLSSQVQADVIHSYVKNHKKDQPKPRDSYNQLSDREKQVFSLLIEGNTGTKIAEILCISSKTVDKHRASISRKIGIDNPVKMVQYAIRHGLIDPSIWED